MTKEEAIKQFESELEWAELNTYPYVSKQKIEADKMAIKALEQEPCEDAVSREEVLNLPRKTLKNYFGEVVGDMIYVRDVMKLPPVTPQPKTGHWKFVHPLQEDDGGAYMCSECKIGYLENSGDWKYCPNCGAKMGVDK